MRLVSAARSALAFVAFAAALFCIPFSVLSQGTSTFPPAGKVLLAVNPITNKVYAVNELGNSVTVIDATGATRTIPVATRPQFIAVDPASNRVFVSSNDSQLTITIIDGSTDTVVATPPGEPQNTIGPMVIDASRGMVYVVRLTSAAFDELTYLPVSGIGRYSISARMYQTISLGLNPLTQKLFVPGYATGRVAIINSAYNDEYYPCGHEGEDPNSCPNLGTGNRPFAVALNPVTNRAYGISESAASPLWIVNGDTNTITQFVLDAGPTPPAPGPRGIAVNTVTNKAYAVFNGKLVVVDGATSARQVIASAQFAGTTPVGVAVNAATNRIYVAADDGKLTVIDGVSNVLTPLVIPVGASSVGVNPITNKVYVHGGGATPTVLDGLGTAGSVPLTTTITPPGNQASGDVTITMQASSGFAPTALPIRKVYWQLDSTTGAWQAANGSGPWTASFTGLSPGSHTLYAFAVDGQDAPLNSGPQSAPLVGTIASSTFTVAGASSTTSLAASSATSVSGQTVTFTASVSGSAGTPTGTVAFRDGATTVAGCGGVALAGGSAACSTSSLSVGSHSITAAYSGGGSYSPSTSSAVNHTVTAAPVAPAVGLASSKNPATAGETITFTATLSGSRGAPTGTVAFRNGGTAIPGCSASPLASGVATCATSSLAVGSHSITAFYAGSADYTSGTSNTVQQTINAATLPPVAPTVALGSSRNPATAGETITFTATLSGSRGAPTGTVAFRNGGTAISGCSAAPLASGVATCATGNLPVGTHSITAFYAGDANYTPGTSSAVQQVMNPAPQPQLTLSTNAVAFGGQSMATTSPPQTVTVTNSGTGTLTISGVTSSNGQFPLTHDCATLAPAGSCTVTLRFAPAISGTQLNAQVNVAATLSVASNAPGSPATANLTGTAERSLVTHFYRSILRRAPDGNARAYWEGEAARVAGLGADPNEAWYALAMTFFSGTEYEGFGRSDNDFVADLYRTFFNREPDTNGRNYWLGQLAQGMPRDVVLVEFMLSTEFRNFSEAIFGNFNVRAEVNVTGDFYRGLLARLPDNAGYQYWVGQFRAAQCASNPGNAIHAQVEAISSGFVGSAEYAARARTNAEYVADMYNAFMRRGGDLAGVKFWIGQLDSGAYSRDNVRRAFIQTPEFQQKVQAMIAQGCAQ